jgi:hypothetical protein
MRRLWLVMLAVLLALLAGFGLAMKPLCKAR